MLYLWNESKKFNLILCSKKNYKNLNILEERLSFEE